MNNKKVTSISITIANMMIVMIIILMIIMIIIIIIITTTAEVITMITVKTSPHILFIQTQTHINKNKIHTPSFSLHLLHSFSSKQSQHRKHRNLPPPLIFLHTNERQGSFIHQLN